MFETAEGSAPGAAQPINGLETTDAYLLAEWGRSLRAEGWSPTSAGRAVSRVRAFARATKYGLVRATKQDVLAFVARRYGPAGIPAETVLRSESWKQTVRAIRAFYRWAGGKFMGLNPDPTMGIRSLPPGRRSPQIRRRDGRLYERVLAAEVGQRDRIILGLLAHGLTPAEIAKLQAQDIGLCSGRVFLFCRSRRIPLTENVGTCLGQWLASRPFAAGDRVFSGISVSTVRAVVRRAAAIAFPHPSQSATRRRIHASDSGICSCFAPFVAALRPSVSVILRARTG
jgi:site-specific recombinase XerC